MPVIEDEDTEGHLVELNKWRRNGDRLQMLTFIELITIRRKGDNYVVECEQLKEQIDITHTKYIVELDDLDFHSKFDTYTIKSREYTSMLNDEDLTKMATNKHWEKWNDYYKILILDSMSCGPRCPTNG